MLGLCCQEPVSQQRLFEQEDSDELSFPYQSEGAPLTQAIIGLNVQRGPDWIWEGQDGGEGAVGVTVAEPDGLEEPGWVSVRWASGGQFKYRVGAFDSYDLAVASQAALLPANGLATPGKRGSFFPGVSMPVLKQPEDEPTHAESDPFMRQDSYSSDMPTITARLSVLSSSSAFANVGIEADLHIEILSFRSATGIAQKRRCFVTCEIPGKPGVRLETPDGVASFASSSRHEWAWEKSLPNYVVGDALKFQVFERSSIRGNILLAWREVPFQAFHPSGFAGNLLLNMAGSGSGHHAYLQVKISAEDGSKPVSWLTSTLPRFSIYLHHVPGKRLGLSLDYPHRSSSSSSTCASARVASIAATGLVEEYNRAARLDASVERVLRVGDYVVDIPDACSDSGTGGTGEELTEKLQARLAASTPEQRLELRIASPQGFLVDRLDCHAPAERPLGLDLKWQDSSTQRVSSLLITGVTRGGLVDTWNLNVGRSLKPPLAVRPGDRVVQVGGKTGSSKDLRSRLKLTAGEYPELLLSRPGPDSPSAGPVLQVASLSRRARDDAGLLPQPARERFRTAIVEVYVRGHPFGGQDKTASGHRHDTVPLADSLICAGLSCQLIFYNHEEHDRFLEVCALFHAVFIRCLPGQVAADKGDQTRFKEGLRGLQKRGVQVFPSPDVVDATSDRKILGHVANLSIGLEDTLVYYSPEAFSAGFRKTVAYKPRIIKPCKGGDNGEGVWIVKLQDESYCREFGQRACKDDDVLCLMEVFDSHYEEHTVSEFIDFMSYGRARSAGRWKTGCMGRYFDSNRGTGPQGLLDQRFCPRAADGILRCYMVGADVMRLARLTSYGSTYYEAVDSQFASVTDDLLRSIPWLMQCMGLQDEDLPLLWALDFVRAPGNRGQEAEDAKWTLFEINCSCSAIPHCSVACCSKEAPWANLDDVPPEDRATVREICDKVAQAALARLLALPKR